MKSGLAVPVHIYDFWEGVLGLFGTMCIQCLSWISSQFRKVLYTKCFQCFIVAHLNF